jgi:hypothetical protein
MLLHTLVMLLNNSSWIQMGNSLRMTIVTAAIPQTSKNKDFGWELLTIKADSKIISPWLEQNGFLPTHKGLGSGPQSAQLNQTIPYYNKTISMILTVALDPMYQNTHKELII